MTVALISKVLMRAMVIVLLTTSCTFSRNNAEGTAEFCIMYSRMTFKAETEATTKEGDKDDSTTE